MVGLLVALRVVGWVASLVDYMVVWKVTALVVMLDDLLAY